MLLRRSRVLGVGLAIVCVILAGGILARYVAAFKLGNRGDRNDATQGNVVAPTPHVVLGAGTDTETLLSLPPGHPIYADSDLHAASKAAAWVRVSGPVPREHRIVAADEDGYEWPCWTIDRATESYLVIPRGYSARPKELRGRVLAPEGTIVADFRFPTLPADGRLDVEVDKPWPGLRVRSPMLDAGANAPRFEFPLEPGELLVGRAWIPGEVEDVRKYSVIATTMPDFPATHLMHPVAYSDKGSVGYFHVKRLRGRRAAVQLRFSRAIPTRRQHGYIVPARWDLPGRLTALGAGLSSGSAPETRVGHGSVRVSGAGVVPQKPMPTPQQVLPLQIAAVGYLSIHSARPVSPTHVGRVPIEVSLHGHFGKGRLSERGREPRVDAPAGPIDLVIAAEVTRYETVQEGVFAAPLPTPVRRKVMEPSRTVSATSPRRP